MISAVPSVSSVHVELDVRMPSTAGRTDETTKIMETLNPEDLVKIKPTDPLRTTKLRLVNQSTRRNRN